MKTQNNLVQMPKPVHVVNVGYSLALMRILEDAGKPAKFDVGRDNRRVA